MKVLLLLEFLAVGAYSSLLPTLPPSPPTVTAWDIHTSCQNAILEFQKLISDGTVLPPPGFYEACDDDLITFPDGTVINAGIVALPFPFLCSQSDPILQRLVCRLAAGDCTYVHNRYSGKCALSPNPVSGTDQVYGQVLLCNDENPTGYNFANFSDTNQCGSLMGEVLDKLLDKAIGVSLRKRLEFNLCFPMRGSPNELDSVGCNSDCRNNHQYASGTCSTTATPTAVFTGELNPELQCICTLPTLN